MTVVEKALGRRGFVRGIGVVAGVAVTTGSGHALAAQSERKVVEHAPGVPRHQRSGMPAGEPSDAPRAGSEEREFLGSLTEGVTLASHGVAAPGEGRWTIESIHAVRYGAIPIILSDAQGARFQVDVVRRADEAEDAVDYAQSTALYLANRGDGRKDTHEEHGLGVMALALAMRMVSAPERMPQSLLTFASRREAHPLGTFSVA